MPFSPKQLADLCHRLALSLEAGVDVRKVCQGELERSSARNAAAFQTINDAVKRGQPLAEGIAAAGAFPRLMVEMTQVGEESGQLAEVLKRLAQHYSQQVTRSRDLLRAIAWPLVQLGLAALVIGGVIFIQGFLKDMKGQTLDMLGWGLTGGKGLLIYANVLLAVGIVGYLVVRAIRRGALWVAPVQTFLTRLPVVGDALQKIAVARIAWALHLLLNVEIDLRRLIPLALRSAGNVYYERHTANVTGDVAAGEPLHAAFRRTGAFPRHFLDALESAEEGGQIVESMARLSRQYDEEADSSLRTLSVLLSVLVWLLVAGVIITMIFRIFGFYTGVLNDALKM